MLAASAVGVARARPGWPSKPCGPLAPSGSTLASTSISPALLENERELDEIALLERPLQVEQHHVIARGAEHARASGWQRQRLDAAHAHHVALDDVGVDLGPARNR